jgi:Putative prokaryotic signal transducing protein
MKKLTTAESLVMIRHYRNLLESEGIACKVRNEHLGTIAGEVPFFETWPELWVVRDLDFDRAKQLIDGATSDESPCAPWTCPDCGEENEGQFAACWNCGSAL